ncbi:hypothetical protein ACWIUD_04545 [Helicobacter sp. 23-1044]
MKYKIKNCDCSKNAIRFGEFGVDSAFFTQFAESARKNHKIIIDSAKNSQNLARKKSKFAESNVKF